MSLELIRETARKRPEREFLLNRLYGAHISPYFTLLCLRLGLGPDQVTALGALFGVLAVALLLLPLGPWSLLAAVAFQVAYVLDFSDGQVARLTGRSSSAGSYLDWLTHLYIPVAAALMTAAGLALWDGRAIFLVPGILAALELSALAFSGKEHILVAMQRRDPQLGTSASFHAALRDDARPADVAAAADGPPVPEGTGGIAGRAHGPSLRSVVGELLIYPGSVHLLSLAVVADLLLAPLALSPVRGLLLVAWAALFFVHVPLLVRRNHALIRAVEARASSSSGGDAQSRTGSPV